MNEFEELKDRVLHQLGNAAQIMVFTDCDAKMAEAREKLLEVVRLVREAKDE